MNSYKKLGYTVFRGLISDTKIHQLKADAVSVFVEQIERHKIDKLNFEENLIELFKVNINSVIGCGKQIQNLPSLYSLMICEPIMVAIRTLGIESPVINTKPVLFFHNKNLASEEIYYKTSPHQDFASMCGSINSMVAWLPLCEVTEELGPLEIVPESHLKGFQVTRYDHSFGVVETYKDSDFLPIKASPGDVIIFNSLLVHRSGNNITENRIRWSTNFRYSDLKDEYWKNNNYYCPYTYKSCPEKSLYSLPVQKDLDRYFKC
jgi:hypothetical protein